MNRIFSALAIVSLLAGCAADASNSDDSAADSDLTKANNAKALNDFLVKADAPSDIPAGNLGVGGRIARIQLETAQGGLAHFISQSGYVSTVEGDSIGSFEALGGDWGAVSKALLASGVKWKVTPGANGSSSSVLLASVECKTVVAPGAKPTCTVKQIEMSAADSTTLMTSLMDADAPSDTPSGVLGVGSRVGKITVDTSQGGLAHFISESGSVETLAGKHLADLSALSQSWGSIRDAIVAGGGVFKVTKGASGASSSTMSASVECSEPVVPHPQATCVITPDLP